MPDTKDAGVHHLDELEHPHEKLLAIDFATVHLASDRDALDLWTKIAPTGEDWQQRLDELPSDDALIHPLAIAFVRAGNYTCPALPPPHCTTQLTLRPYNPDATLDDPCLRRDLAMWSLDQLTSADLATVMPQLRTIAALPAPESQLISDALRIAQSDQDKDLELLGIAWKAGQHELVDGALGGLDEAHLLAATQLHIDGAYEGLSAATQRAVFLKALADEQLRAQTRTQAMSELLGDDDKLAPDLQTALIAATRSPSCQVAAAAAMQLVRHGQKKYLPGRSSKESLVRSLCVIAAYEPLQRADELSPFPALLPARGLELVRVTYDPYSDVDTDGDGDPHTEHTGQIVPREASSVPEVADFTNALAHCAKTICNSDDRDYKLTVKNGELTRLEIVDRPPCL